MPVDAAGQHAVQDNGVERLARRREQTVATDYRRGSDDVAGFLQPAHDEPAHVLVVFHHEECATLLLSRRFLSGTAANRDRHLDIAAPAPRPTKGGAASGGTAAPRHGSVHAMF